MSRHDRNFQGNYNYVEFYNRYVNESMNPSDNVSLTSSKICSNGKIYYGGGDELPGSNWTAKEKETFFHYLSRYSIHQIELIKQFLPDKSIIEIRCYYNILKAELNRKKRLGKPKYYTYKINKIRDRVKLWKVPKGLLKYDELPSAYEMSEEFIKLEEYQSDYIAMREARIDNDNFINVKRTTSKFIDWGNRTDKLEYSTAPQPSMATREYGISVYKLLTDLPPFEPLSEYENEGKDGFLTSFQKAGRLSELLYANNGITQKSNGRLAFEFPALLHFDEIAKLITKKILLSVFEKKALSNRVVDTIYESDIIDAINSLPYKDIESLFNLSEYFGNLDKRLDTAIEDDYTNGRKLTHNEFYNFMVLQGRGYDSNNVRQILNVNNETMVSEKRFKPPLEVENPFIVNSTANENDDNKENSIKHIGDLKKSREITTVDDLEEEILIEKLNKLEEIRLSKRDKYDSLIHERGLLAYLMTNNYEAIQDRIYNEEEGEEILEFWQNEEELKKQDKYEDDQIEKRKRFEYEIYRQKLIKHAEYVKKKRDEAKNSSVGAENEGDENGGESGFNSEDEDLLLDDLEIFDPDHMDEDAEEEINNAGLDEVNQPSIKVKLSKALISNFNYTFSSYNEK